MTVLNIEELCIEIVRKRVKRLNLHVTQGRVWMSIPQRMTAQEAEAFVRCHLAWIRAQLAHCTAHADSPEDATLWGAPIRLRYCIGKDTPTLAEGVLTLSVSTDTSEAREHALTEYYRVALAARLREVAARWENATGLQPCEYRLRTMKTRWGTCSIRARRIWLNTRLAAYLPDCLDYVLVHELVHLAVPNHSAAFWSLVEQHYPNWRTVRKQLK